MRIPYAYGLVKSGAVSGEAEWLLSQNSLPLVLDLDFDLDVDFDLDIHR